MSKDRRYVDMLGFLGDVGPPMFDELTKENARASGVRLFLLTTTWPMLDWKATLQMHRQVKESLSQHQDVFQIVSHKEDLRQVLDSGKIGVILGMQDPGCIGASFDRVHRLFDEGIRVMQVAYQKKNLYGCGFLAEDEDSGLSEAGRQFVETVNTAGMILDLSHLSPLTALDSIKKTKGPTMISHTVSRAVYDHPRGSNDAVLSEMAKFKDTLIGILAMTFFLDAQVDGLGPFVDHLRHISDLVGPDKVAVGTDGPVGGFTDLDAAKIIFEEKAQPMMDPDGALKSRWPTHIPELFENSQGFDRICQALAAHFDRKSVEGICGSNAWRFLSKNLPAVS
jgi:membrane dipeptidase